VLSAIEGNVGEKASANSASREINAGKKLLVNIQIPPFGVSFGMIKNSFLAQLDCASL
jgi:hypothetical protein